MGRSRVLVTLLTAASVVGPVVMGLSVAGAQTAQAAVDPRLTVTSVQLNRTAVAVSGLNTYPIGVTVEGGYDSGDPADANVVLNVVLERQSGTGLKTIVSADLKRTAGTPQHGTWTGSLNVASTANGTFKVTGVMTGPYGAPSGGMPFDPTPYPTGQTITVTGTHQPKVTASVTPKIVPIGKPYSIRWAVTDAQTGKPYGTRLTVGLGVDTPCAEGGSPLYRTDTNGIVIKSYLATDAGALNCLQIPGKPYLISGQAFFVFRQVAVSAVPSRTSAPVGTIVGVNGSVSGAPSSCPVNLQRLYGATQWRTVGTAKVRDSGRFTLSAQPAYRGQIPYRVSFPVCPNFAAALSRTFSIRGL
jgi:hypothetical protein